PANGTDDRLPNWSPLGDRIVFQRRVPGSDDWDLYTMKPDGSDVQRVTTTVSSDTDASWSPDGRWIVYSSDYNNLPAANIFAIPAQGGTPVRITQDVTHEDCAPSWSPDGQWISFESHTVQVAEGPASLYRIVSPVQVQPPALSLDQVRYWAYQLQGISDTGAVNALVQSQYDMLVLEPTRTDWSSDDMNFDTKGMVTQLKNSLASDGQHRKMVLAYADIAQAEDWRWYWTWSTETNAGANDPLPGDWPDFIVGRDPDGWVGNYPVAYWDSDWKDIIIYGQNTGTSPNRDYTSVIDEAIRDGFDGIYLDWVEAFEDTNVIAAAQAAGVNPEQEMVDFIGEMRTYALARDPDFIIIQQNASALLDGHPELLNVIDGIAQEEVWYDGDATDNWDDPNGYDHAVPASWTSEYLTNLAQFKNAGKPVFNCEYALTHASTAYSNSYAQDFVPYVSRRSLGKLTTTPPPGMGSSNTAPVATNDTATVNQDSTSNVINVLSNDTDADSDTLTVTSVGSASHGTAQLASGQVRYTPTAGYSGSDSFSYTISDGNGGTDSATVSVTVTATSTPQDIFFLHQSVGEGIMADHGGNPGMVSQLEALGHTFDDYDMWNSPPGGSIPTQIASLFADSDHDGTYGDAFQNVSALNGAATADVLMMKSCFYTLWELETPSNLAAWEQAFINNVAAYANQNPDQKIVVMSAVPLRSEAGLSDAAAARARDWGEWLAGDFITNYTTQGNVYSFDLFNFYADSESHATNANALKRAYCRSDGDEHPNNAGYTAAANAIVSYLQTYVLPGGSPPPQSPEVTVMMGAMGITDGQTAAIDFGSVAVGGAGPTRIFTVRNIGTQTLTLGTVSLPTGFTLTEGLSSSLAAGATDTFTVRLDTATLGAKSGEISFSNNDSDENPFNFAIQGTVTTFTTDVDLTVALETIDLENPMQIGDEVSVGAVQSNSSASTDVDGEYAVAFYLSANTTAGDADDILLGRVTDDWVGAGDSTWSDGNFAIPTGTAEGSYYLYAVVDADGDIAESNEANNTAWSDSAVVTVTGGRILRSGGGVMRFSDGDDRLMVIYAGPGYAIVKDASGGNPEESDSPIAAIEIHDSTLRSRLIVKDIDGGGTPDTMTLGRVTTGAGESLGMIQIVNPRGQVEGTTIDVDGSLRKFLVKSDADNLDLNVGADLNKLLVLGAVNRSALRIGGDMALARFKGAVTGTTFDVTGTVRKLICTGGVAAGSTLTLGGLEKVLLVRGELAGTIDVTGSAAPGGRNSNTKVLGDLSGSLLAGVFGNVRVMGTFAGQIGDAGTSAGAGNLLLIRNDGGGTVTPGDAFERTIGM
ncbi:MAG: choice-of-anchor D domain-containing protein, partial [Planctomycetes bacterium]|nr:choice-of-anchor D domain-containing protein [Planctomycetota bacterium]